MSDSSKQEYQAVVIGGGIAGVAIVRALEKIGLKDFLVIDSASAFGTKTSGHDAALCHPYVGRGASRLQRLTQLAFSEALEVWKNEWHQTGVFYLPKYQEEFNSNEVGEHLVKLGYAPHQAVVATFGSENFSGIYFPKGGWINIGKVCRDAQSCIPQERLLLETTVKGLKFSQERWQVMGEDEEIICQAHRVFVASALGTQAIMESVGINVPLKPVRGQLTKFQFEKDSIWHKKSFDMAICGNVYVLPPEKKNDHIFEVCLGSTYDENSNDLNIWPQSNIENIQKLKEVLNLESASDPNISGQFVGIRCVSKDRLPVMGPIRGRPGLYVLTALGSRAVMWSALATQIFSEHLSYEIQEEVFLDTRFFAGARLAAAGLTSDLLSALSVERFFAGASNSKPILPSD